MNKLDGFFKMKVEGISMEPRPEAWSRLEANLLKKNKGLIWFRAAAAFLLAGLFITSIIWWRQGDVNQQEVSQIKKVNPSQTNTENKLKEEVATSIEKKSSVPKSKLKKQKRIETQNVHQNKIETKTEFKSLTPQSTVLETIPNETVAAASVVEKPIVIEYTLESIRYLKQETPVLAETDEKKNSLQKAIEFAREAKNSDGPLGGLRQAKDDLFALNFKKDKQKKQ